MSDQDLRDRLNRDADNWLERARAEQAMKQAEKDRHRKNADIQAVLFTVIFLAVFGFALVKFIEWVSR